MQSYLSDFIDYSSRDTQEDRPPDIEAVIFANCRT